MKPLKPPKKLSPHQVVGKLWQECKRLVRARYMTIQGHWYCFTCGRLIDEPAKAQTGHFVPSGACGAFLRYDLRNLRIQCYHCNINLGGNGAIFYKKMVEENGQDYVDQIFKDRNIIVKSTDHNLELLEKYQSYV